MPELVRNLQDSITQKDTQIQHSKKFYHYTTTGAQSIPPPPLPSPTPSPHSLTTTRLHIEHGVTG